MAGPTGSEMCREDGERAWTRAPGGARRGRVAAAAARVSFPEANEEDAYVHQVRAVGRVIGSIFRWIAYGLLLAWAACAPESLAPHVFRGFLIGDVATWVFERGLQAFVWRTHRFSPRQIGGDLVAFGLLYVIWRATGDPDTAAHPPGFGATETAMAIFFTVCARSVAIGVRRMHDITLGTGR